MHILLTDAEIEAIARLTAAATPGPWTSFVEGRDHSSGSSFIRTGGEVCSEDIELSGATAEDQDFIAAARQIVPRLLDEVLALKLAAHQKE